MTTTAIILSIVFILCLTSPVAARSVGLIKADDKPAQKWLIPLVFGVSQGLMALFGHFVGRLVSHLFVEEFAPYLVFVMMLVVAVKLFVDSLHILKGRMLYTINKEWDFILLSITAAFNTFLMSLTSFCFMPFGQWFFLIVAAAGFLWSYFIVRTDFTPGIIKKLSFIEFSATVFMAVIACLYLFTDLMK